MTDYVLYVKSPHYGSPGYVGYEMDGKEIHDQHGGEMLCPRCGMPLTVARRQIEHGPQTPCSIGHTGGRLDLYARCGAHWVTGDPEEQVPIGSPIPRRIWGTKAVYRRPVIWHGDV